MKWTPPGRYSFHSPPMSVEVLPSYTPEVLPKYDLIPTTSTVVPRSSLLAHARDRPRYHYVSDRMDLDLGVRRWGTRLPAYGRDGFVEGTVTIRSFKHVDRVVVHLIGKAVKSHVINQIPTLSQTHTILHKSTEVWSSNSSSSSDQPVPAEFPFSFTLGGNGRPLPPSSSTQLRNANAYIAYAVRVDMYRRGVYMHQTYVCFFELVSWITEANRM
ncbi:hypothetical protein FS749_004771 [Ceratobasidium sp. UAMH 11750]|nr:hypothetical protein FS749_004771 [Ceratobasidium sp. UAMH 11750]